MTERRVPYPDPRDLELPDPREAIQARLDFEDREADLTPADELRPSRMAPRLDRNREAAGPC